MAYHKNTLSLEKMLLKFLAEPDPMLAMLEWLCHQLMEVEVENKLNAGKGEHSPERASLGYWTGPEYWNKGYCTEAGRAVMEFGFEELGMERIFCTHLAHNPASGRVMQKLGMQKEGVLRRHERKWGKFHDLIYYGILKHEYLARRSKRD